LLFYNIAVERVQILINYCVYLIKNIYVQLDGVPVCSQNKKYMVGGEKRVLELL